MFQSLIYMQVSNSSDVLCLYSIVLPVKMDPCSDTRKEFQGAHMWENFKHRGKIYWRERK